MDRGCAIIIGAGLGGLLCGRILSREGFSVTILEQGAQAGGALQTFVREGIRFDTGFHSVGGLGPGEPLEAIFRPLGLMSLPWERMEEDECIGCDEPFFRLSSDWEVERSHILEPYLMSIWRLRGGGKTLVDALAAGQRVLLRKKVVGISDHVVSCSDRSSYRGDIVVSDIHPLVTMNMVADHVRPAYIQRLESFSEGPGAFTVYAKLRPGALRHLNHSIFIDGDVMIHFGEAAEDGSARSLDIIAFRPADSDRESVAQSLVRKASQRLPGLPEAIERYWTSTPATWERYTGTPGGTAYGIPKHSYLDYIAPQTPLPWLFLTGQNIGLHGVLGTSVSALNTCKTILQ